MAFQAPQEDIIQPSKSFKAPDEDIIQPSQAAQDKPTPSLVEQLTSRMPIALSEPDLITRPLEQGSAMPQPVRNAMPPTTAELVNEAHAKGQQHPSENAAKYEASNNYPPEGITTLSPSLDVAFAGQVAKDVGLGLGKTAVEKVGQSVSKRNALKEFIESSKKPIAEGVPTTPIVAPIPSAVESTTPKIEAYVKGTMGGGISPNTGKPIAKVNIYGVKGDPKEIAKLGFGEEPASIPEDVLKKAGIPLPGQEAITQKAPMQLEFPKTTPKEKGIVFNKRQTGEIEKALGKPVESTITPTNPKGVPTEPIKPITETDKLIQRAAIDEMREPIVQPTPKVTKPLLPGAEERIKAFADTPVADIDPRNPLTSRAELNKKVGALEKTATDQWLVGVDAENKALEAGLKDKTGLREVSKIAPDSLESEALFHYIENPNKMEAYGKLASTAGKETADDISKAGDYIRGKLDAILPEVNKVRRVNGLPPIRYRQNYITHMNEMNVLSNINKLDLLGTKEGETLAKGISEADTKIAQSNPSLYTKLKDVVFPYVRRKNEEHASDAINAFDRYVDNAHRYIQTQPYVNELINSASAVESKNPNLASYLRNQANFISGGRSPLDKATEMVIDKDLIRIAQQLQNNAKGNVITLNPSVPITQLFGLTSTVGKYPIRDSLLASIQSFADPAMQKYALSNSPVLQTRALQAAENDLTMGPISKQSAKLIAWFDYKVAEVSWISAFKNAIRTKPLDEALNEANEWAAITQSHLGRVSTSPMMQSKVVQTVLPLMNQQVAAARSLLLNTFQGKTLTEKGFAAAKIFAYGTAVAALKSAVTGREDNPLSPTNVLPFGGVLERGVGGPLFNSASRLVKSKSQEDFIRQLIRTTFLLQNKIPGGVQVGRVVENAFMSAPKKKKK